MAEPSTFGRYADRLAVVAAAKAAGVSPDTIGSVISELNEAVAAVDGRGFSVTPFGPQPDLARAVGLADNADLWVKDETANVSGSHKGRHLFGVALGFALDDVVAQAEGREGPNHRLAIASCGNAALAAAVVAAAGKRPLEVFVPDWADPSIVAQIGELGADVRRCSRVDGVLGDPAHHEMLAAIARGATPFSCQGTDTPNTVDGARTLAYEMLDQGEGPIDRLVIQVGGGALATAVVTGLAQGRPDQPLPVVHAVQPDGNHPLVRAWDRVIGQLGIPMPATNRERRQAAEHLGSLSVSSRAALIAELQTNPERYMEPWPVPPVSYATGILDDVTYDWLDIIDAMLASGGFPVVADDTTFQEAHRVGQQQTGRAVCPTGASGLAGLMVLVRDLGMTLSGERVAVIFSGHQRPGDPLPDSDRC